MSGTGHTPRLSWKPKRAGKVYCAPACGRGCTFAEFERATKKAEKIAKLLPGFSPRTHENLGWFYEASNGKVSVGGPYDPTAKKWGPFHACYDAGVYGDRSTPLKALQDMLEHKAETLRERQVEVDAIRAALKQARGGE